MIHWNANGMSHLHDYQRDQYERTLDGNIGNGMTISFDEDENLWLESDGSRVLIGHYEFPDLDSKRPRID